MSDLFLEPGFLVEAAPERLSDILRGAADVKVPALRAYRRALDRLRMAAPAQRAGILQAMALTEEPSALDALGLADLAGWTPLWSGGYGSAFHLRPIGHTGPVLALAFGAVDGRTLLASGGVDQTVRLWDAADGATLAVLTGHTDDIVALAFGRTGDQAILASASHDYTVRVWDVASRGVRSTVTVPVGQLTGIVLVPDVDGRDVLVTGTAARRGPGGGVDLWDSGTGEHLKRLDEDGNVRGLCVVPVDGRTLLAGTLHHGAGVDAVRLWDPATGLMEAMWVWQPTPQDPDKFAALGRPFVVGSEHERITLGVAATMDCSTHDDHTCVAVVCWDARTYEEIGRKQLARDEELLAGTTADGHGRLATTFFERHPRTGATSGPDVQVSRIDGKRLTDLQGHTDRVRVASFGEVAGATVLATAGDDATVLLWDADTRHRHPAASGPQASGLAVVTGLALPVLAVGTSFAFVELLDPATGNEMGSLHCNASGRVTGHQCDDDFEHCSGFVAAATVEGRSLVASCGQFTSVVLWDPATGEVVRVLEGAASVLAFGEVGGRSVLATNGYSTPPTVWDPATGERITELRDAVDVSTLAFGTAEGRVILATAADNAANLWDPLTGEHLLSLPSADDIPRLAAGRDVLALADDDKVRLWETPTGYPLSTVVSPDGPVTCLALATVGDVTLLVTGGLDGTVRLWDAATGQQRNTLATFARPVTAVATASLDGQTCVFAQAISGRLTACRLDTARP